MSAAGPSFAARCVALLRRRDRLVLLAALALLLLWEFTGWDLALSRRFGGRQRLNRPRPYGIPRPRAAVAQW